MAAPLRGTSRVNAATVRQVQDALKRYDLRVVERVRRAVSIAGLRIQNTARRNASKYSDTGQMRAGIHAVFPVRFQGLRAEVEATANHSAFVEFGTGARNRVPADALAAGAFKGRGKRHYPPWKALVPWVRRHRSTKRNPTGFRVRRGKKSSGDVERAARAVAHAIWKRGGLDPRPFMVPAVRAERKRFNNDIARAAKAAERGR